MSESLLLAAVISAVIGSVWGAVSLRKPTNDTSWRKEPPLLSKNIRAEDLKDIRKEPTL